MGGSDVQNMVEQTGLRKQEVAAAIGTSVASLRRWEREGIMPEDKRLELQRLAHGGDPSRPIEEALPAVRLAEFSSAVLIEELARRARGGWLRDSRERPPVIAPEA